ncbi:MAG: antibiotic biosynthesis monooxygenase [Bacteroidales bacterium]|nr:antibiotic biosynthesis monooxygenase [Bacteroidales bacterium]
MIVTCVHVNVIPSGVEEFIRLTRDNHNASILEPGNLRFDLLQMEDDSCHFMIYEAYESQEASDLHKTTLHYIKWRDAVKDLMAETRQGIRYRIVEPSSRSQW